MLHKDQITKKISPFIHSQLPLFLDLAHDVVSGKDISTFGRFIQLYYEWLETSYDASVNDFKLDSIDSYKDYKINGMMQETGNPYDRLVRLQSFRDVDNTTDTLLRYIRSEYVDDMPLNAKADRRKLVKRAKELYRIRGSEQSLYLIFKVLFDKNISIFYPRDYVFNPSDSSYEKNKAIRVQEIGSTYAVTDDDFDQWKGYYAVGATSGAKAVIADIDYFGIGTDFVADFFLDEDTMSGTFAVDEEIEAQTTDGYSVDKTGTTTQLRAKIFPSIQGISFTENGTGYYPDDAITLSGTTGSEIVIKSLKKGQIEDVVLDPNNTGDSNYKEGDKIIFANTYAEVYDKIGTLFTVGSTVKQWPDDTGLDTFTVPSTEVAKAKIVAIDIIGGGGLYSLVDTTPAVTAWEVSKTWYNIPQIISSGDGDNATFDIVTDSSGNPTITINSTGSLYKKTDTITLQDPGSTSNIAIVTVSETLFSHERWWLEDIIGTFGTDSRTDKEYGGNLVRFDSSTASEYRANVVRFDKLVDVADVSAEARVDKLRGPVLTAKLLNEGSLYGTMQTSGILVGGRVLSFDQTTPYHQPDTWTINQSAVSVPATHISTVSAFGIGGGTGLTTTITTNASGDVTGHAITDGGSSYTSDDFIIMADPSNIGIDYPAGTTITTFGSLVEGLKYKITTYDGSDDFVSVGANRNAVNEEFVATGTSPTTWNDDSVVKPILEIGRFYRIKEIVNTVITVASTTGWSVGETLTGSPSTATAKVISVDSATQVTVSLLTSTEFTTSDTITDGSNQSTISAIVVGDGFINVGASSNAVGQVFLATGSTPTTWTTSKITKLPTAWFSVNEIGGEQYTIIDFKTGDNFTNVGGINQTGAVFTATGSTPATWTNSSKLQRDKQTTSGVATTNPSASGSGFTVNYKTTGGKITEVSVGAAGTLYDGGVEVTINGNEGSGTDARVEILTTGPTGSIARIEVVDGGVNYTTPPKARVDDTNGSGAVVTPHGTDVGAIESVDVLLFGKADNNSTVSFREPYTSQSSGVLRIGDEYIIKKQKSGLLLTITDTTPTPSGAWEASKSYTSISQTSSNGSGLNATFDITTDSSGNPTVAVRYMGAGYLATNTIVLTDPGSTSNTATITVATASVLDVFTNVGASSNAEGTVFTAVGENENVLVATPTSWSQNTTVQNLTTFKQAVGTVTYGALVNYDGYSLSNKSMLNHPESLIEDLEKYQKWSYAVRVSEDPSNWIGRVKELAHPAGMRVTAEYEMDSLMESSLTVTTSTINVTTSTVV